MLQRDLILFIPVFLKDSLNSNNRINTVSSYQNYMLTGMKDGGCYITLLNDDGISDNFIDKLHIGDSFSVYDNTNSKFVYTINEFLEEELDNTFFTFDVSLYPDIEVIDFR